MNGRFLIVTAGLLGVAASAGCEKGCRNDHPYVPYTIGEEDGAGRVTDGDASASLAEEDGGGPFAERPAEVAPSNATQWTLDGILLTAPAGRAFALGLVHDFDGDGARDVIAVVRSASKVEAPGEVLFYRGRPGADGSVAQPSPIAPAAELTNDPGAPRVDAASCASTQRLGQVGKHSAFVEIGVTCAKPSAATRWIAVLLGDRVHIAAVLYDPPGFPKMTVSADGSDVDNDTIDDVALRVTLEGGGAPFDPGPKVSATLKWLDRPAGLSRDAAATDASFASLASIAMARAARGKEAPSVPAYVAQVRSLFRAICPEAGTPRIKKVGSGQITCGASRSLEDANIAEVRALVSLGDPLRAIAAFDRAQRAPATKTAARTNEAQGWIAQAAPLLAARATRPIAAVPRRISGSSPAWGSLAFEATGKLLVRTSAGVVRVDAELGDEVEAEGVAAWPTGVVSPDGSMRWIEAYNPCDGFALRATFAPTGEAGQMRDVVLPIGVPLGPRCASKGEPASAIPIAWGLRGLEAIVAGEPVLFAPDLAHARAFTSFLDQPSASGGPRSPDGRLFVLSTSQGLLVRGAKPRLYRAADLDGTYAAQQSCVISDDATHVACVRGGRAWVGSWEAP